MSQYVKHDATQFPVRSDVSVSIELVEALLAVEDMCEDITAPDGTSAAAIALGHKNAEICVTLLESGIEPRDNIVFLARELLKVEDDDRQTEKLKESVKKSLRRMKLLAKETSDTDESNSKGAQKLQYHLFISQQVPLLAI